MDIEMKVQILRACSSKKGNRCSSCPAFGHGDLNCMRNAMKDAATALSTLQAENKMLRDELKNKVELVFQQAKELDRRSLFLQEQEAELDDFRKQWDMYGGDVGITAVYKELEQVKRALAMMWFAYINKSEEFPHSFELEALEKAEHILGPWEKCMLKYLKRGQEEG